MGEKACGRKKLKLNKTSMKEVVTKEIYSSNEFQEIKKIFASLKHEKKNKRKHEKRINHQKNLKQFIKKTEYVLRIYNKKQDLLSSIM